ncbi:MAG: hypothetical protein NXI04_25455 [Planctomycetaceae bacterium]|nr:hypothetical protein [Planctomycetaceae bacterium]
MWRVVLSAWKLDVFATWVLVPLMCLTAGLLMAGLAPRQGRLICGMVSAVAALIASLALLTLVMAAFADGMLPGVAAVLLPPYLLFWVLRHWSEVRGGFLLG